MKLTSLAAAVIGVLLVWVPSASAGPMAFNFVQGGYAEGAEVTGMFSGEDLNDDDILSSFDGEILSAMMSFSGNSIIPAFSLDFDVNARLFGLIYFLDGGPLGDDLAPPVEGIALVSEFFIYLAGPGPFEQECGVGIECAVVSSFFDGDDFSNQLLTVTAKVPAPGALALLGLGLTALGAARRRAWQRRHSPA